MFAVLELFIYRPPGPNPENETTATLGRGHNSVMKSCV